MAATRDARYVSSLKDDETALFPQINWKKSGMEYIGVKLGPSLAAARIKSKITSLFLQEVEWKESIRELVRMLKLCCKKNPMVHAPDTTNSVIVRCPRHIPCHRS